MGCLCPRKVSSSQTAKGKGKEKERSLGPQAATQQDFMVQSERKKILPVSTNRKSLREKAETLSQAPTSPSRQVNRKDIVPTKSSTEKAGLSSIIVSQIGGSKLERMISLISTQADIAELNQTVNLGRETQQMVVVSTQFECKEKLKKIQKRYYCLIKNKLYVKKNTSSIIKIKSISSELSLFCNNQTICQTIHVVNGTPIQNIRLFSKDTISYLDEDTYPLTLTFNYQCKKCTFKKIKTSSSCKISFNNLKCKCGSQQFKITKIETSPGDFPVWHQGVKINKTIGIDYRPEVMEFRTIGCNICWKLETCKPMKCGCLRCFTCNKQHSIDKCILCL